MAFLGIKRKTLYAYVSRGLVRSVPSPPGKRKLYARDDLLRLRARHDSRAGHGPVAGAALKWGEPVLESAITDIRADGPWFRGRSAVALAQAGASFEEVAELLWTGKLGAGLPFPPPPRLPRTTLPAATAPLDAMLGILPALALRDPGRFQRALEGDMERAQALIRTLAAATALGRHPERLPAALRAGGVAASLAAALGARGGDATRSIERCLIVGADHELNASTFAARVAASAESDLYACVMAALATLTGPRHGGASDRVEGLLGEIGEPRRAREVLLARLRRGEAIPGFGHRLYPDGDPRGALLLAEARRSPARGRRRTLDAVVTAMAELGGEPPNIDAGLVAVVATLGLPPGTAVAIFAVGRLAGTVAHIFEQRAQDFLLRPRARYIGPR